MKSLSDLVDDSEDCSGQPVKGISISVTEPTFSFGVLTSHEMLTGVCEQGYVGWG